mgnify:CR=1 FL=1
MTIRKIALAISVCAFVCGCNLISSVVHDDQVVAKVGNERLYRSELDKYIPDGSSPEDSAAIALQYINTWAAGHLFLKTAESRLTKEEKNVDKELEEYRMSLLRYRYEQRYINDRLDTLITQAQLEEYYKAHAAALELPRPILKVRFVDIMSDSPNYEEIMEKLPSEGGQELKDLDSLAYVSAPRFFDSSDKWMDAAVLAREFGTDYNTMLSKLKNKYIIFDYDDRGEVRAAYVFAIQYKGQAPLEYCSAAIRDNILSERKREILSVLEQDLLKNAQEKKELIIYKNED